MPELSGIKVSSIWSFLAVHSSFFALRIAMLVRLRVISGNVIHLEINSPAFLCLLVAPLSVFSVSFCCNFWGEINERKVECHQCWTIQFLKICVLKRFFGRSEHHDFANRSCRINTYKFVVINFEKKPTLNAVWLLSNAGHRVACVWNATWWIS